MSILSVTIPLFLFLLTGYICKQKRIISDDIKDFISKAVYYVAFPAMTVMSIVNTQFGQTFKLNLISHNILTTWSLFIISFVLAYIIRNVKKRGAFNMASFRSNQGYMGLPIVLSFFGTEAMAKSAVINGFDTLNVIFLSVIALDLFSIPTGDQMHEGISKFKRSLRIGKGLLINFITNPFIIGAILGLLLSYLKAQPFIQDMISADFVSKVLQLFSNTLNLASGTALPLSLILVGASIDLKAIRNNVNLVAVISVIKLIIAPISAFVLGYYVFGFRGLDLGICVTLPAMPSAVSSYIMAKEMGADEELCAAAIGLTTFISVITISVIRALLGFVM